MLELASSSAPSPPPRAASSSPARASAHAEANASCTGRKPAGLCSSERFGPPKLNCTLCPWFKLTAGKQKKRANKRIEQTKECEQTKKREGKQKK